MQPHTKSKPRSTASAPASLTKPDGVVAQAPIMYFDSLVGMGLGPFVSRITLGIQESGTTAPRIGPALTLVMPTAALHQLAREVVRTLDNPQHRKVLEQAFLKYQQDFPPSEPSAT